MNRPKSIEQWSNLLWNKKMNLVVDIIDAFIKEYQLTGSNGIVEQHDLINSIIRKKSFMENRLIIERYAETAYMIWFFTEYEKRRDVLDEAAKQFSNGSDDGDGSPFRNFEYQCHIAIRFIEEGYIPKLIELEGCPDFEINGMFTIECKRPTKVEGIFKGVLKSKKQIEIYQKPGFVFINIDDLNGFDFLSIDKKFKDLLKISNYAFGRTKSLLCGAVIEYVDNVNNTSHAGAYTRSLLNRYYKMNGNVDINEIKMIISMALNGDSSLVFHKSRFFKCMNYDKEWDKNKTDMDSFNKIILKRHWHGA
jgi:hypothetical protein